MKLLHYGFLLVGAALGLAACSEDNPWMNSDGEGGILPLVNADSHVKDAIPTRATAMTPDVQEFGLKLTRSTCSGVTPRATACREASAPKRCATPAKVKW